MVGACFFNADIICDAYSPDFQYAVHFPLQKNLRPHYIFLFVSSFFKLAGFGSVFLLDRDSVGLNGAALYLFWFFGICGPLNIGDYISKPCQNEVGIDTMAAVTQNDLCHCDVRRNTLFHAGED